MPLITPIAGADPTAVESLLDAAFGADRHGRTAYRLRAGAEPIAELSFAAHDGGTLVGTLQSWPVALDDMPLTLVGPVAVRPDRQQAGVGKALMAALLTADAAAPGEPMVLIGDAAYYGRFGFVAAPTTGWTLPGPFERHRLLARVAAGVTLPRAGMLGPRRGCDLALPAALA